MPGDRLPRIDVDAVLRRARARRRPRVIAAISGGVLALAAIAAPVVAVSLPHPAAMTAGSAASAPDASTGDGARQPAAPGAERLQRCGAPLARPEPAANGLVTAVTPLTATAGERGVPVEVTLVNTGATRVTGSTAAVPAIALSRDDGTVVWHTSGPIPLVAVAVDLAPGASMHYRATLRPAVCTADDETGGALPAGLPDAAPGGYRVSAAITFLPEDGTAPVLVTGPAAALTLLPN